MHVHLTLTSRLHHGLHAAWAIPRQYWLGKLTPLQYWSEDVRRVKDILTSDQKNG